MKNRFFLDLGRIMDEIFDTAQEWGASFKDDCLNNKSKCGWEDNIDYYPFYSYPPANVYITTERNLIFEFAMAGFKKEDIGLTFHGDYMILSAKVDDTEENYKDVKFFKHRLKMKEVEGQKYYVPADKFDRDKVEAVFTNGLLKVTVPALEEAAGEDEVKIEINVGKGE